MDKNRIVFLFDQKIQFIRNIQIYYVSNTKLLLTKKFYVHTI